MTAILTTAELSRKSRKAYERTQQIDSELREVRAQLEPLHRKMLELQDASRLAYERMNIAFHEDGLTGSEGFRLCQEEDASKAIQRERDRPDPMMGTNDPGEMPPGHA
jgi:hypothetical protein